MYIICDLYNIYIYLSLCVNICMYVCMYDIFSGYMHIMYVDVYIRTDLSTRLNTILSQYYYMSNVIYNYQ